MCFSATADLVIGGFVVAVGVDAVQHVTRPAQRWVAAIPIVLGVHQMVESAVWSGLGGGVGEPVLRAATWIYLAIAFGVMPLLVPVAVGALEPAVRRRRTAVFVALGALVAAVLMHAVVRGPVDSAVEGRHIAYTVDLWHGGLLVGLYVVATCGALLVSSHLEVRWFGAANLAAVALLAWLDQSAVISLWCAWAAITSVAIAVWLRSERGSLTLAS